MARIIRVALPPWGQEVTVEEDGTFVIPNDEDTVFKSSVKTHASGDCGGEYCCLHNPSDHPFKDAPMILRLDREVPLVERVCEHGTGHPDPDSVAYFQRDGGHESVDVHGCCGCCTSTETSFQPTTLVPDFDFSTGGG